MRFALVILLALALMGLAAASEITKLYPFTVVDSSTPLRVWQVTLSTDSDGNATYESPLYGKLYSLQIEHNNTITGLKNLTISSRRFYNLPLQSYNLTAGNATLFPRSGANMYPLCGQVNFTCTNTSGSGGADVNYNILLMIGV